MKNLIILTLRFVLGIIYVIVMSPLMYGLMQEFIIPGMIWYAKKFEEFYEYQIAWVKVKLAERKNK